MCRFQKNGEVFLTDGSADETWGNDGRDADDYDVAMTEITKGAGASGHYVGPFDLSGNIEAGTYQVAVYHQLGANPADSDPAIAQGELYWDGDAEINWNTIDTDITIIIQDLRRVKNVYGTDTPTTRGLFPEV